MNDGTIGDATPGIDHDAGVAQVGTMWNMMLGQMTQAGATRMELALFTMDVAREILGSTTNALWPQGTGQTTFDDVAPQERDAAKAMGSTLVHLTACRNGLAE